MDSQLSSWRDGDARSAIVDFVNRVTDASGEDFVPPAERVAVFDNDGTLWCEKPMPIELGFILQRLEAMAEKDPELAGKQPWKAAHDKDYTWLGDAVTKHYTGDDSDVKVLLGGALQAFAGVDVEDYVSAARDYLHRGEHPTLGRGFRECGFRPMIDLCAYLEANGFTNYIASGGDRDFMRAITEEIYGIPPERVIGTSSALRYQADRNGGSLVYGAQPDVFDDGPTKVVRIWSRIGRRPILAAGNANGDIPMLEFAGGPSRPALRLLVLHDDADREFDYTTGSDQALERAEADNWTVVSVRNDWVDVF